MAKTKVTRTYGPIHFEDLDPHRFEDLVRELIYDYKEWQTIEATGRSGSDDGFDIRAYEKVEQETRNEEEDEEVAPVHPMDGNMWMIQGKREKGVGPKRVKEIIDEIDSTNTPYGYILAASANFSKKSYDVFRDELRKKGVMEFYLWGKAEMEDMLHLPKNDRIPFTFFGISLVSRKRSQVSAIRSTVVIKNKLIRALGDDTFNKPVLLRDLKDTKYPFEGEYGDFEKYPRWREYRAYRHHPLGIWCHIQEYYAYIDTEKKEWDFTKAAKLVHKEMQYEEDRQKSFEDGQKVRRVWEFFKRANQGTFIVDGLVRYDSIELIDDRGDNHFEFPHLYVDFKKKSGPFSWYRHFLEVEEQKFELDDTWREVEIFPEDFPSKPVFGKIHKKNKLTLNETALKEFNDSYDRIKFLCDTDGKYDFLKQKDVISIANTSTQYSPEDAMIQITSRFKTKVKDYLEQNRVGFNPWYTIKIQLEREPNTDEEINIYESKRVSKWDLEEKK